MAGKLPAGQREAVEMVRISDIIRAEFAEGDDKRDAGLTMPENLQICAVALNCGQCHMGEEELDELTGKLMEEYLSEQGSKKELRMLCADDYVTEKFPLAFIMTAEDDFLRNQAPRMYEKLKIMNVPCEFRDYSSGKNEKLGHVFHLNIRSDDARRCNDEECRFFREIVNQERK